MRLGLIALLAVLALPFPTKAQTIERGRDLFEAAPGHGIQVKIGQRMMPARGISCAGCHGRDAGGGAEVQSGPPIDWPRLQAEGYATTDFIRALTEGIAPDGRMLGGAMPRLGFQHPDDPQALIAYLKVVADLQRSGITDTQITLRRPPLTPATQPFWQAFQTQLQAAAPYGIYGRQIVLADKGPALAMIGAVELVQRSDMPTLFPLVPLLGDEDPAYFRSAFATIEAQVRVVASQEPQLHLLADDNTATRLRHLLKDQPVTFIADLADLPQGTPVMLIDKPGIGSIPEGSTIYTTLDHLPHLRNLEEGCVQATNPRPAADTTQTPLARYGKIAADVMSIALRRCGKNCTRTRLVAAFEGIKLPEGTAWPRLDYGLNTLGGTDGTTITQICGR